MSTRRIDILFLFLVFFLPVLHVQAFWWSSSSSNTKNEPVETQEEEQKKTVQAPSSQQQHPPDELHYGVDISFPMHHAPVSTNYAWLPHNQQPTLPVPSEYEDMPIQPLGDMQTKYENYIQGCVDFYNKQGKNKGERCIVTEQDRLAMSLRQPQSVYNYTQMGFTKIRAPDHVFQLLKEFWDKNKHRESPERWAVGNVYTNHWESPSYMVSVENSALEGGGYVLKQHIWNAARDTIEEWTGYKQAECSLYGIRVYKEGAMLAPHVDRLPLVSSAIINVDQDVDEPWPLEVIGHDGIARNVTMEPGDLVLYESHSILHGRPFPLKGRFMANVFIHFEPIQKIGGSVEYTGDLPPYLIPGSPEEPRWRANNPHGHKLLTQKQQVTAGSTEGHHFAANGAYDELRKYLDANADQVNARDQNGWTPLHEAIRKGNIDCVELLLDRGAEANAMIPQGSPLYMARDYHGTNIDLIQLLQSRGAKEYPPSHRQSANDGAEL